MDKPPYLVLRSDDIEPFTHPEERGYHSQHVLGKEITGGHDLLLNRGTVDPNYDLGGGNHPDNDEIYYAESGECLVDLGGHPDTGEGHTTFTLVHGRRGVHPGGHLPPLAQPIDRAVRGPDHLAAAGRLWRQRHPRRASGELGQRPPSAPRLQHRARRWRRPRGRAGLRPPRRVGSQPATPGAGRGPSSARAGSPAARSPHASR